MSLEVALSPSLETITSSRDNSNFFMYYNKYMEIIYILIALIFVAIGLVVKAKEFLDKDEKVEKKVKSKEDIGQHFRMKERFFTKSEYMFFQELEKQNNGKYHIFSKVRMEDIVEVKSELDYKVKRAKRNYIKSRHIDFVLVDKETGSVVKAIELDGKSHSTEKQKRSDEVKNQIFRSSGFDLLHVRVGEDFKRKITEEALRDNIA